MRRYPPTFPFILVRRIQIQHFAAPELPARDVRLDGEYISGVVEHPGIEPRSGATLVAVDVDGEIGLLGQGADGEVGFVERGVVVVDAFDGDGVVGGGVVGNLRWGGTLEVDHVVWDRGGCDRESEEGQESREGGDGGDELHGWSYEWED